jgi:hypothetical protein
MSITWKKLQSHPEFKALPLENQEKALDIFHDDLTGELLSLNSRDEDLGELRNLREQNRFRLRNPEGGDKEWQAFAKELFEKDNARLNRALPLWKEMLEREDAPLSEFNEEEGGVGVLAVNPRLLKDPAQYRQAVMALDVPASIKADALRDRPVFERYGKNLLYAELSALRGEAARQQKRGSEKVTDGLFNQVQLERAEDGSLTGRILDPRYDRQEPTTNYMPAAMGGALPTYRTVPGALEVPGLKEWATKAAALGLNPEQIHDRLKTRQLWGEVEDQGNLIRRDPEGGELILNRAPMKGGEEAAHLIFEDALFDREATRLKLTEPEKDVLKAQLDEHRNVFAHAAFQTFLTTNYEDIGALNDELKGVRRLAEFAGLKADFQAFAIANQGKTERQIVETWVKKYKDRPAVLRATNAIANSLSTGITKFESGAVKIGALAADLAVAMDPEAPFMPLSRMAAEYYAPIERRANQAEGVSGVPFGSDIVNETAWILATLGSGKLLQAGAKEGAERAAAAMLLNIDGRTAKVAGALSPRVRELRPVVRERVSSLTQLADEAALQRNFPQRYAQAAEMINKDLTLLRAELTKAIGQVPMTATVFGSASARSSTAMWADAYLSYTQKNIEAGMPPEEARAKAAEAAVFPAVFAGIITPVVMKLIPGGTEQLFGVGVKPGTHMTLGQLFKGVGGSSAIRQMSKMEASKAFGKAVGQVFYQTGRESLEESVDEMGQVLVALASYNPDMTVDEALKQIGHAAALGGLMGSVSSTIYSAKDSSKFQGRTPGSTLAPGITDQQGNQIPEGKKAPTPAEIEQVAKESLSLENQAKVNQFEAEEVGKTPEQLAKEEADSIVEEMKEEALAKEQAAAAAADPAATPPALTPADEPIKSVEANPETTATADALRQIEAAALEAAKQAAAAQAAGPPAAEATPEGTAETGGPKEPGGKAAVGNFTPVTLPLSSAFVDSSLVDDDGNAIDMVVRRNADGVTFDAWPKELYDRLVKRNDLVGLEAQATPVDNEVASSEEFQKQFPDTEAVQSDLEAELEAAAEAELDAQGEVEVEGEAAPEPEPEPAPVVFVDPAEVKPGGKYRYTFENGETLDVFVSSVAEGRANIVYPGTPAAKGGSLEVDAAALQPSLDAKAVFTPAPEPAALPVESQANPANEPENDEVVNQRNAIRQRFTELEAVPELRTLLADSIGNARDTTKEQGFEEGSLRFWEVAQATLDSYANEQGIDLNATPAPEPEVVEAPAAEKPATKKKAAAKKPSAEEKKKLQQERMVQAYADFMLDRYLPPFKVIREMTGLRLEETKAFRDRIEAEMKELNETNPSDEPYVFDPKAEPPAGTRWEDKVKQSKKKNAQAQLEKRGTSDDVASKRAANITRRAGMLNFTETPDTRKADSTLKGLLRKLNLRLKRETLAKGATSERREAVRLLTTSYMVMDHRRALFAAEVLRQPENEQNRWIENNIDGLVADAFENTNKGATPNELAQIIKTKWAGLVVTEGQLTVWVDQAFKVLNTADVSRANADMGGNTSSLDQTLGEDSGTTKGEVTAAEDEIAPDDMADALGRINDDPVTGPDVAALRNIGALLKIPESDIMDPKALAKAIMDQFYETKDGESMPTELFKGVLAKFSADMRAPKVRKAITGVPTTAPDRAALMEYLNVARKHSKGHLYTHTPASEVNLDPEVRAYLAEIGIEEGNPESLIAALERAAADPKTYGKINSANARIYLNQQGLWLKHVKALRFGGKDTYRLFNPDTKDALIHLGTEAQNSAGIFNGIIEEIGHVIDDLTPLTAQQKADLRAQILKSRELLPNFQAYLESRLGEAFPRELIADLHYSMGYAAEYDPNEKRYVFRDLLDGTPENEFIALAEFRRRIQSDPFTKLVLGSDLDFKQGMFAWHAKRRFNMVPDPNSRMGLMTQGMLQADGEELEILQAKAAQLQAENDVADAIAEAMAESAEPAPEPEVVMAPSAEEVVEIAEEVLSDDEKAEAAAALDEPAWSQRTAKRFAEGLSDWVASASKVKDRLTDLFSKVWGRVTQFSKAAGVVISVSAMVNTDVAVRSNVNQDLQPLSRDTTSQITPSQLDYTGEPVGDEVASQLQRAAAYIADDSADLVVTTPTESVPVPGVVVDPGAPAARTPDFKGKSVSKPVRRMTEWVAANGDNEGRIFVVADKQAGTASFFDAEGKLIRHVPALFGKTVGDFTSDEILGKSTHTVTNSEKITPAGRFETRNRMSSSGNGLVTVYREGGVADLAFHKVYLKKPAEKREQRLASKTGADNRVSHGCINLGTADASELLPMLEGGSVTYILPETKEGKESFSGFSQALNTRTSNPEPLTPPISMFRSRQALGEMGGVFKALGRARDGTVPWMNLKAKIEKGFRKDEAAMVLAAIEPMAGNGRINPDDAVEAMDALARASVQVVKLAASPNHLLKKEQEEARLAHLMDTQYPGWAQAATDEFGDHFEPSELPGDTLSRFPTGFADDYAAWWDASMEADPQYSNARPESASARYTMVNPKPLDQMPGAQDITVEEPLTDTTTIIEDDRGNITVPSKFSENIHFPTRKNVIGFARMYTETLNGREGTFVFEVQSDWASRQKSRLDGIPTNLENERSMLMSGEDITRIDVSEEGAGRFWVKMFGGNSELAARYYDREPTLGEVRRDADADMAAHLKTVEADQRSQISANSTPLLSIHETLSLKAAIHDALAKGQTWLAVTDAETGMMTEQHDTAAARVGWIREDNADGTPKNITRHVEITEAEAAKMLDSGYDMESLSAAAIDRLPPNILRPGKLASNRTWTQEVSPTLRTVYSVGWMDNRKSFGVESWKETKPDRPTQEPGMRAAYDPKTGRLHAIMRKLTGDKGVPVNFGAHQNAQLQANEYFATEAEARAAFPDAVVTKFGEEAPGTFPWRAQTFGSPVFNGKTDITAIRYDITQVKGTELSALFTRNASTPGPLTDAVKQHAPSLAGRKVWAVAPQAVDPRLKAPMLRVFRDRVEIDPSLENDLGQAARLLAKEDAYQSFRRTLAPSHLREIAQSADKAAFIPFLNTAAADPVAADALYQSMDDVAVEAILRQAFEVELDPGFMDALEGAPPVLNTRTRSAAQRDFERSLTAPPAESSQWLEWAQNRSRELSQLAATDEEVETLAKTLVGIPEDDPRYVFNLGLQRSQASNEFGAALQQLKRRAAADLEDIVLLLERPSPNVDAVSEILGEIKNRYSPSTLRTRTVGPQLTAHPIPGFKEAFIKDVDGHVLAYSPTYDPAMPVAPANLADKLEHARMQLGLPATRLGTRNSSDMQATEPLVHVPPVLNTRPVLDSWEREKEVNRLAGVRADSSRAIKLLENAQAAVRVGARSAVEITAERMETAGRLLQKHGMELPASLDAAHAAATAHLADAISQQDALVEQRKLPPLHTRATREEVDRKADAAEYSKETYFHGTDKPPYDVFDMSSRRFAAGNHLGDGAYFTLDRIAANGYTKSGGHVLEARLRLGRNLKLSELSLEEAMTVLKEFAEVVGDDKFSLDPEDPRRLKTSLRNTVRPRIMEHKDGTYSVLLSINNTRFRNAAGFGLEEVIRRMGYDSVTSGWETVVFSPSQIKSADLDTGVPLADRFDRNNPSVLNTRTVRVPLFSDNLPLPRFKRDLATPVLNLGRLGKVYISLWSGTDTLKQQGGFRQAGLMRSGKLPSTVSELVRQRDGALKEVESLGTNFAAEVTRFIGRADTLGLTPEAAENLVDDALGSTRNWTDTAVEKKLDADRKVANKQAQGVFLRDFAQVTALRQAGDPAGADALHETLVQDLRDTLTQNQADMAEALRVDETRRYREAKAAQTAAFRSLKQLDLPFFEKFLDYRQRITAKGKEIAAYEMAQAQAMRGRVSEAAYQAALEKATNIQTTFDRERGLWLHRTYQSHHDPKWYDHVMNNHPDLLPVIAEARDFIRGELVDRHTRRFKQENRVERQGDPTVPILKEADARVQATTFVDNHPDLIKVEMADLLRHDHPAPGAAASATTSTARPSILRHRQNIPDPIRALMGEIKDARLNGAMALVAATQRVSNKKFLHDLVELGAYDPANPDKPFFLVTKGLRGTLPSTAEWEPVISEGGQNEASPLAGLYGPAAVREAMQEIYSPAVQGQLLNAMAKVTGYAMSTKTSLSIVAQMRNVSSNFGITLANGNLTPAKIQYIVRSMQLIGADISNKGGVETRAFIGEMVRRGVMHDGNMSGMLRDLQGDLSASMDMGDFLAAITKARDTHAMRLAGKLADAVGPRSVVEKAGILYQAGDDVFKLLNYFGEKHSLEYIYEADLKAAANDPTALAALEESIKEEAARIVRNTVPTYSLTPELLKMLRRSPVGVAGLPFVNWTAEIIRTSYNIIEQGSLDLARGATTGNARLARRGAQRLASFTLSLSMTKLAGSVLIGAAKMAMQMLAGDGEEEKKKQLPSWLREIVPGLAHQPSDEEERAYRRFAAPWDRNASLLFMGKDENGKWRTVNLSFTDPYDYWKKIWRAGSLAASAEGESGKDQAIDAVVESLKASLEPFLNEQVLAGAVTTAVRGEGRGQSEGAPRVRWYDLDGELRDLATGIVSGTYNRSSGNLVNGLLHIIDKALMPGTAALGQDFVKAQTGVIEGSKVFEKGDLMFNMLGFKVATLDPTESAGYQLRALAKEHQAAFSQVLGRTFTDPGTAGGGKDLDRAVVETMERQRRTLAETRKVAVDLQTLGIGKAERDLLLADSNFTRVAVAQINKNTYFPMHPSKETFARAATSPGGKGQDRVIRLVRQISENQGKPVPLIDNDTNDLNK